MSSDPSDTIPKLNAGNYHVWYAELSYLLQEKSIWGLVNGTVDIPTSKAYEAAKDREKAFGIIMRSIEPALRAAVKDLTDPKKILDTLRELYGTPVLELASMRSKPFFLSPNFQTSAFLPSLHMYVMPNVPSLTPGPLS